MEYRNYDRQVDSQHRDVHLGDGAVRSGLDPNASSSAETAVEQIHESSY